jgi:hypothetical protein
MTTRLPIVLDELRVASPCHEDWDEMAGDERVRFCGRCEKNVYNLSSMSRADAETLVREKEGRLCVRFFRRTDGTLLTADCPDGARRKRLRQRMWAAVSGWAASAALLAGIVSGRARADLSLKDGKTTASQPKPTAIQGGPAPVRVEMKGQMVAPAPKPAPAPKKKYEVVGELG